DEALARLRTEQFSAVVLNTPVAGWNTAEFIEYLREANDTTPIIVRDREADLAKAVELTRAGAFHAISSDAPSNELAAIISAAIDFCPPQSDGTEEVWRRDLIGNGAPMREVIDSIRLAGPRRCTVLISGETGTGKELVARALHLASPRACMPMVSLNCA